MDWPGRTGAESRVPAGCRPPVPVWRAQVLEGHRILGVYGQVALLLVGHAQGHAGVGVARRELQAAAQQLYAPVELAEVR